MRCRTAAHRIILLLLVLGIAPWGQSSAEAQLNALAGVVVDAQGVLDIKTFADPGGQLTRRRIAEAKATLDADLVAFSKLRKISLNRLEEAIRRRNGKPSDEMRNLAGLLRLRYVFCYPETRDIVIAGPAEGWARDPSGRTVGMTSARAVMQLQDLVVALRAFGPGGRGTRMKEQAATGQGPVVVGLSHESS